MEFVYDDGGRATAGFTGDARDCVTRAISIATGRFYGHVYKNLADRLHASGKERSARNGIPKPIIRSYLDDNGWKWTPTMFIGSGCTTHLREGELPDGRLIVSVSRHLVAVIDHVIRDTHDPTRDGTRCVYGYWQEIE